MYITHAPGLDTTTGLFSAITLMDMIGGAAVNLSLGKLFGFGLKRGGIWLRLPFFFAGLLLAVIAVIVFIVDVTPLLQEQEQAESLSSPTLEETTSSTQPNTPQEPPKSPDDTTTQVDLIHI